MQVIDTFLFAVPTRHREIYRDHARRTSEIFRAHGATRVIECWDYDIPEGTTTSLPQAVQRREDESLVLALVFWPSAERRDDNLDAIRHTLMTDPEFNPPPYDTARLIHGAFEVMLDERPD